MTSSPSTPLRNYRLRRELTDLHLRMLTHADHLRRDGQRTASDYAVHHAHRLAHVLDGGT